MISSGSVWRRLRKSKVGRRKSLLVLAALAALAGCEEKLPGRALADGIGREVSLAPGGGAVSFILGASHPDDRAVPEDLFIGDLWLADLRAGGPARKIGSGVPTGLGNTAWRADGGALATLGAFRFRTGEGELWVTAIAGAPRKLADSATRFDWAPKGEALAWIAQGRLLVGPHAANSDATLAPVEGAQSFSWSPDGKLLAVRGMGRGRVVLVDTEAGTQRELAKESTDFAFASDGALGVLARPGPKGGDRDLALFAPGASEGKQLGRATSFTFSPDGKDVLLFSTESSRGEAFGDLLRVAREGGTPQELGEKVSEFRFSRSGALLFLANYDPRARAGTLVAETRPGEPPREIGQHVQTFQLSPAGDRVLYTVQNASRTDFKVELWTAELAEHQGFGRAPRKVDEGVYGYLLSPDGKTLFWKSKCEGARACELMRAPIETLEPTAIALLVTGFDFAPASGRLLVAHPHKAAVRAVDLTLQDAFGPPPQKAPAPFIEEVDPSSRFADDAGHRVIAPLLRGHNASVRVIDLP